MPDPPHVLVPLDDSPQSMEAFEHAIEQFPEARLTLITVIDPIEVGYSAEVVLPSGEWFEAATDAAEERFETARAAVEDRELELETAIEVGRPARVIVDYADDHGVDHVVMGSHGRSGVARVLLGSVAETVVRRSPVPVTVVR